MGYITLEEEILMWPFRYFGFRMMDKKIVRLYLAELIFQWTVYAQITSNLRNSGNTTTI